MGLASACKLVATTLISVALLGACASTRGPAPVTAQSDIDALNHAILSMAENVDPDESARAARIAYEYSRQLAGEYQISDSPILHNIKVNLGIKPRGLCIDWTSDLLARLREEKFHSLDLHWGIANYQEPFRIEHSTAIISARGETLYRGLVLDPWRNAGELFWSPTLGDSQYAWKPQTEIHAMKRQRKADGEERIEVR